MKALITFSLCALALGADLNDLDQKKLGVSKSPNINTIPGSSNTKSEQFNYYYQPATPQASQNVISPLLSAQQNSNAVYQNLPGPLNANNLYTLGANQAEQQNLYQSQINTNLSPPTSQYIPIQFFATPRISYAPANKVSSGNHQYALVPPFQSLFVPSHSAAVAQNYYQQPASGTQDPNGVMQSSGPNHYAQTSHMNAYPSQNPYTLGASPFLNYPPPVLPFNHNSIIPQPSTMFIFSQPNPNSYGNYLQQSPNLIYPTANQSPLNYYHAPQAQPKYSFLPYNSQPASNSNVYNSYQQTQANPSEYDKSLPTQLSQSSPKIDNDISLNNNEYITSLDTSNSYKPLNSYSRSQNYKT